MPDEDVVVRGQPPRLGERLDAAPLARDRTPGGRARAHRGARSSASAPARSPSSPSRRPPRTAPSSSSPSAGTGRSTRRPTGSYGSSPRSARSWPRSRAAPARTSPAASGSRGTSKARFKRPTPSARRASSTSGARPSRRGTARRPGPTSRTSPEQASAGPWPRRRTRARRRLAGASRSSGRPARSSCAGGTPSTQWRSATKRRSGKMLGVIAAISSELAGGMRLTPRPDPVGQALRRRADRRRHEDRLHADAAGDLPGTCLPHPRAEVVRGKQVQVETAIPLPIALDSEQPGTTPRKFEIVPGALRVRVPGQPWAAVPGA